MKESIFSSSHGLDITYKDTFELQALKYTLFFKKSLFLTAIDSYVMI